MAQASRRTRMSRAELDGVPGHLTVLGLLLGSGSSPAAGPRRLVVEHRVPSVSLRRSGPLICS